MATLFLSWTVDFMQCSVFIELLRSNMSILHGAVDTKLT